MPIEKYIEIFIDVTHSPTLCVGTYTPTYTQPPQPGIPARFCVWMSVAACVLQHSSPTSSTGRAPTAPSTTPCPHTRTSGTFVYYIRAPTCWVAVRRMHAMSLAYYSKVTSTTRTPHTEKQRTCVLCGTHITRTVHIWVKKFTKRTLPLAVSRCAKCTFSKSPSTTYKVRSFWTRVAEWETGNRCVQSDIAEPMHASRVAWVAG